MKEMFFLLNLWVMAATIGLRIIHQIGHACPRELGVSFCPLCLMITFSALWINPGVDRKEAGGGGMPGEEMGRLRRKPSLANDDALSSN